VNTSSTGKHPKDVLEIEIFIENHSQNFHGGNRVRPASLADVGSFTARTDIIIHVHIDIEDHFLLQGHEGFFVTSVVSIRLNIEHCADINFKGKSVDKGCLKLFCRFEAQIATVNVVFKGKRELTLVEIV
jgi:hypothetical protein